MVLICVTSHIAIDTVVQLALKIPKTVQLEIWVLDARAANRCQMPFSAIYGESICQWKEKPSGNLYMYQKNIYSLIFFILNIVNISRYCPLGLRSSFIKMVW